MHIAQGVFKAANVNKCIQAGGVFIFWVADWFALMNDKMGGDLEKIQIVGKYFIEVWRAAGMDMSRVKFAWAADEITKHADTYWLQALDICRRFTTARIKKCGQIMGRNEASLTAAQILYPIMQCTDIFFLKANVCQLGVDQRKVNMLAREYCDFANIKLKPVILSHHMIYGLTGDPKMSKSKPDSAIFMEDTPEDVRRKIQQAYCPRTPETKANVEKSEEETLQLVEDPLMNPCLDYLKNIIFAYPNSTFTTGDGRVYTSFATTRDDFIAGVLSEESLKEGLINAVNALLQPVRDHFNTDSNAKEILEMVKLFKKDDHPAPPKSFRRLTLFAESENLGAVFAPVLSARFKLSSVLSVLANLKSALKSHSTVVLWLPDWRSFVLNSLTDVKLIDAAATLFVEALQALAPELLSRVLVLRESEAMLKDPGNYWISVINVGRKFSVNRVQQIDEANDQAGHIIGCLMHVADVLSIGAKSIYCSSNETALHELAAEYISQTGALPNLPVVPTLVSSAALEVPLKPHLQGEAAKEDAENELFLDDTAADVKRKIKRAFCEPGNTEVCPPLTLADCAGLALAGSFLVSRKPENGGDQKFETFSDLRSAFASGQEHTISHDSSELTIFWFWFCRCGASR
eukprot:c8603_g1_i2.p1 GENE.c8603_g1_i2~~c8603_g1_i2.p1  ORF type:complete len:698 (+),score=172.51 c8603_g1_i2:196-2094(+)